MNAQCSAEYTATVALVGKVPVKIKGDVCKGDMIVSAGNGCAMACNVPTFGMILGKSLEDFSGDTGVINIVVGRL
jgi:hypothetical protein